MKVSNGISSYNSLFEKLLSELVLPPEQHPRFKIKKLYHLTGVERGKTIVALFKRFTRIDKLKVLDVGCGSGGISVAFADEGAHVVSIDLNKNYTRITRVRACEKKVRLDVVYADACSSPFGEGAFDILVCNDVVEHISKVNKFFSEVGRLLKPDGLVFIETHNRFSPEIILSDPHSGLPLVVLLPKRVADSVVRRWSGLENSLFYNATYLGLVKKLDKNGIEIFFVDLQAYLKEAKTPHTRLSPSSLTQKLMGKARELFTPLIDFWIKNIYVRLFIPGWRLIGRKKNQN